MVFEFHLSERGGADFAAEVFLEIEVINPKQIGQAIEKDEINVLEFMKPIMLLVLMQPHPELDVYVAVHSLNVGEGMVVDIMLHLPDIGTSAHHVQCEGSEIVDPFLGAVASVGTVVHHIETNAREVETKQAAQQNPQPNRGMQENEDRISGQNKEGQQKGLGV